MSNTLKFMNLFSVQKLENHKIPRLSLVNNEKKSYLYEIKSLKPQSVNRMNLAQRELFYNSTYCNKLNYKTSGVLIDIKAK